MDLFLWITQACNTLTSTVAPSVDAMGVHICVALATIMLVWFGVQEALASAQGGPGFSVAKFLNFFMLITFAYVMVNFYDSSIPGIGYSLKGFINGGAQHLVDLIGTDSAANILNTLRQDAECRRRDYLVEGETQEGAKPAPEQELQLVEDKEWNKYWAEHSDNGTGDSTVGDDYAD